MESGWSTGDTEQRAIRYFHIVHGNVYVRSDFNVTRKCKKLIHMQEKRAIVGWYSYALMMG